MTAGIQPNTNTINQALGNLAVSLRNLCEQIEDFFTWSNSYGQANLEALGFSSADAQNILTSASYLNTIAAVYKGTATQGTEFDFDNALSILWGAQ